MTDENEDGEDEEEGSDDEFVDTADLELLSRIASGQYFEATGDSLPCFGGATEISPQLQPALPCAVPEEEESPVARPPAPRADQRRCVNFEEREEAVDDLESSAPKIAVTSPADGGVGRLPLTGGFGGFYTTLSATVLSADMEAARAMGTATVGHGRSFMADWFAMSGTAAGKQLTEDLEQARLHPSPLLAASGFLSRSFNASGSRHLFGLNSSSDVRELPTTGTLARTEHVVGGEACMAIPRFIALQVTMVLWVFIEMQVHILSGGEDPLEEDPIMSRMKLTNQHDCIEDRQEVWRWITYQAIHMSPWHLFMNLVVLILAGIPLERFHGGILLCFMFNMGVVGGALCYFVSDPHIAVIGMSGGCYALQSMHLSKLGLNWHVEEFRIEKLVFLLLLGGAHILQARLTYNSFSSHSTHFGGTVAGLCLGLLLGRSRLERRTTLFVRSAAFVVSCVLISGCLWWWATARPPSEIWEREEWCWARQVSNVTLFGDPGFRCVRCSDFDCIRRWSAQERVLEVSTRVCHDLGWAVTER